jgi:hypothetical protein
MEIMTVLHGTNEALNRSLLENKLFHMFVKERSCYENNVVLAL